MYQVSLLIQNNNCLKKILVITNVEDDDTIGLNKNIKIINKLLFL